MLRQAIIVLTILAVPAIADAQQANASSANLMLAIMQPQEAIVAKATGWSGQPEAEPIYPAPAPMPAFRSADVFPVLGESMAMRAANSASLHNAALHVFTGARFGDFVQLNWVTTTGNHSVGFEIERRTQSNPVWETIEYFRSKSRRGQAQNYAFNDQLHDDGVVYYRLRQIGASGIDIVSPVISVTPDNVPHSFSIWKNSSMPFQNYGTVSFGLEKATDVTLSLFDRFGKTQRVLLDNSRMDEGHHIIPFGTAKLQPGLYILRITTLHGSKNLILLHS